MKKILVSVVSFFLLAGAGALQAENVGVPSECEDVMLQVFYWDSYKNQTSTDSKYGRTKWIDLLKDTAAINANFDLVWFPPSAMGGGVGYTHKQLSNQDSDWGTKTPLKNLITALHKRNTKVLADVVINHRGNKNNWCDFYLDNFGQYGTFQLTQKHICRGDEGFTNTSSSCYNAATSERGAADTGSDFDGARDLDHTNEYVQNWSKAYVQWLINVMNYDGFRYDMTLGYHGKYLSMYNEASNPYLSVSELWDGIDRQVTHLKQTNYNTMIFDFPLKFVLNNALGKNSNYRLLANPSNSLRNRGYRRYSVTFIDNHDTFERGSTYGNNQFGGEKCDLSSAAIKRRVLEAHAYILMMPGVPCVFWPHWKSYQSEINALIAVRKEAGIHSESFIEEVGDGTTNTYEATIQGHNGRVILRMGPNRSKDVPDGYVIAIEGGNVGEYTIFYAAGAQGVEEVGDGMRHSEKFIENGKLLIRRGERVYDMLGRIIK